MDGSTTLTLRLPTKLKKDLEQLANSKDRSKSYLAVTVLSDYVAHEEALAADLKKRLERVRSGKAKLYSHAEVMAMARATIHRIARSKR